MVSTEDSFGVRANRVGVPTSGTEDLVTKIATRVDREVFYYITQDDETNFRRDVRMVHDADRVYAFFANGQFMQGGTGHVVACALREGKPVEAYELDVHGNVVETATDEGDANPWNNAPSW